MSLAQHAGAVFRVRVPVHPRDKNRVFLNREISVKDYAKEDEETSMIISKIMFEKGTSDREHERN